MPLETETEIPPSATDPASSPTAVGSTLETETSLPSAAASDTNAPVTWGGVAHQYLTGAESWPYAMAGAPADLSAWALNKGAQALGYGQPFQHPVGGSEWLERGAGQLRPALNPENFPARNLPERIARSAGEATAGAVFAPMAIPEAATGVAATEPMAVKVARTLAGDRAAISTPGRAAATAIAGAGSGAGSQFGGEFALDSMSPEFRREHPEMATLIAQGATLTGGGIGGLAAKAPPYLGGSITQDIIGSAERDRLIAAGNRLGVDIPRYMVSSPLLQRMGQVGKAVPWAGTPLEQAPGRMFGQMGEAAEREAGAIGSADPTGRTAGEVIGGTPGSRPGQTPITPPSGMRGWTKRISQDWVNQGYNDVTQALSNPNVPTILNDTRQRGLDIYRARTGQRLQDETGSAVRYVTRALMDPNGMTFDQIKGLRTRVGQMLDDPSLLPQDADPVEMKNIYHGLSTDLRTAAFNAGGNRGLAAFDAANQRAAAVAQTREQLVKFLGGPAGDATDEKVFGALKTAAGTTKSGDLARLNLAKQYVLPGEWDEMASSLLAGMGRDKEDNFSPARYLSDYGNFSPGGKDALFGANGPTRQALDDLSLTSSRAKELYGKYENVSKTGHVIGGIEALKMIAHEPLHALPMLFGARLAANALARPATAGALSNFARTHLAWAAAPSDETLRQMRYASARVSAAMAASFGVRSNPDDLVNASTSPQQ